jgi:hypothetical protein
MNKLSVTCNQLIGYRAYLLTIFQLHYAVCTTKGDDGIFTAKVVFFEAILVEKPILE